MQFFIFHFIDRKTVTQNLFIERSGRNSHKNNAAGKGLSFSLFILQTRQKHTR